MKQFKSVLVLAALMLAPLAQAQVVVTVDDKPSDDAAYVDGTGGNFSGDTALKSAVDAVNADASGAPSFEIKIIDTDGVADTYHITANVTAANLTIHQVPNGNGNDAPATIQAVNDSTAGGTLVFFGAGSKLAGLSTAKPLNLKTAGTGTPNIITGEAGDVGMTWENLNYINSPNDALDHNDNFIDTTKPTINQTFNHCTFSAGNGPQTAADTTYNDCKFIGGGFKVVQLGGNMIANRCDFTHPSAAGLHLAGAVTSTFNDCSFKTSDAAYGPRLINTFAHGGLVKPNAVLTFNRPIFTGYCGDILFSCEDDNITLNVVGTPANKVDLDGSKPVLFARITSGKINLIDCKAAVRPGAGGVDCADGKELANDVDITMNRCIWGNGAGEVYGGDSVAGAFKLNITATNTIWYGDSANPDGTYNNGHLIAPVGSHTGGGEISLTHCTLAARTGNAFFFGTPETKLFLEGCIIYTNKITTSHYISALAYDVRTPHIPCLTYVFCPDDGAGVVFEGNPFNPGTPFDPAHEGDLVVPPGIDLASGKGVIPANSSACGAATGSTITDDVNGNVRPLPAGTAPDIGAVEVLNVPVELSTFAAE